jgi:SAM-dependent methyltransferase
MNTNRLIGRHHILSLDLPSRIALEMKLTDREAERILPQTVPDGWRFENYWKHLPYREHLFRFLGSLEGRTVLDLGCGYNLTPIYFALAGARKVYACDVSPKSVAYMRLMAQSAGVADRVSVLVCAGEQLPLGNGTVDLVHGDGVLHHLHVTMAGQEIARVLKPGGRAGFKDPLGHNLILEFVRDYVPYRWKKPAKGTDSPLTFGKVEEFGRSFSRCTYRGFGFFSLIVLFLWGRGITWRRKTADVLDHHVLRALPFLQRYCRFVVTCVEKQEA